MPVFINADYEGWFAAFAKGRGGKGFTRQGKRILLREANRKTVDFWHRRFIPRHFDSLARHRYHYQQRKRKYRAIKRELAAGGEVWVNGKKLEKEVVIKGGRVDIVRSGKTESMAEAQTPIRATASSAKTRVLVPSYVVRRIAGTPNQVREIQKTTKAERQKLTVVWKAQFARDVKRFGTLFHMKRRLGRRSGRV